jgi:hypothetical protein
MPQSIAVNTLAPRTSSALQSASSAKISRSSTQSWLRTPIRRHRGRADDSMFKIEQLEARLSVDMKANLFRTKSNGILESTQGLELLDYPLSGFEASNPRNTKNALRTILSIAICEIGSRHWALEGSETKLPSTPCLIKSPS